MARFMGYDPALGLMESFHAVADDFAIETRQDVEPIIESNKRLANDGDGFTPSRDMRRIATVPLVVAEKWRNELGVDIFNRNHAGKVRALLNDPDWRFLRTSPGRF